MRLSFKYKYKKIFWLLLGFCLACICVQKVHAYTQDDFEHLSLDTVRDIALHAFDNNTTYVDDLMNNRYKYCFTESIGNTSDLRQIQCYFFSSTSYSVTQRTGYAYNNASISNIVWFSLNLQENSLNKDTNRTYSSYNLSWYNQNNRYPMQNPWSSNYIRSSFADSGFILSGADSNFRTWTDTDSYDFFPPSYLDGYKKITLSTSDRYYMLSGLSEGYVFIPTEAFLDYGGRLSYYDNDLDSQPYTSYIQDYILMPDGEYVRQSFNLSNYSGADWVMFSKYIYLEGEDNISYDIYVPNDIYDSDVEITPNETGGNNFDFDYKDENGDIQSGQIISTDLSQVSPLLGNIFSDFSSNTFGLTSIITAPLGLISSLSSSSCSSLSLPLPYVNTNLTLPCMTTVYQNTFGSFFTLYQTITFGIVAYWVIVKIFNIIKDAKNPDHDEIEVIDL